MTDLGIDFQGTTRDVIIRFQEEAQSWSHAISRGFDNIREIDPGSVRWLDHAHTQMSQATRLIVAMAARETHNHVSKALLRLNIKIAVAPTIGDLLTHLVNGVATQRAVANDLPLLQQCVLRVEVDAYMGYLAQGRCKERVQAMHNNNFSRMDHFGRGERTGCVIIDRFDD